MPKYLYTSDLRISELTQRIQRVAQKFASGLSITDKSEANNAATLQFYFNLEKGTKTLRDAVNDPISVIRNYVLKFQFPNPRTSESLKDSIEENTFLAPYRMITSILQKMREIIHSETSSITQYEILYYIFCSPKVYQNPTVDTLDIARNILQKRELNIDLEDLVKKSIEWKQYDRQSREFITVLEKCCSCLSLKKGVLTLDVSNAEQKDLDFIDKLTTYNDFWYPSDANNYQLTQKEYISYMDTNSTPYNIIQFNKKRTEPSSLSESDKEYKSYISAIRTKPFLLLAGISGTGKSRIVRKLAQATTTETLEKLYTKDYVDGSLEQKRFELHKPANFEIIQVKPNWHNSMDVIGYQTNIPSPRYVFTPFVEFIAKAWMHKDIPFFLCLDEMNLAPVEEYFAEFLSAIESRSKNGSNYETDPIIKPFSTYGKAICDQMLTDLFPGKNISDASESPLKEIIERFKSKGLTLPENLIVIGTVNMDETTFSFSRKVLDRAMSFEMNEVNYDSFLLDVADIITKKLTEEETQLITKRPIKAQEVKDDVDAQFVIDFLTEVNKVLDNTPFKLGYRAANEAMLYVAASHDFGQANIATALDEFTTMKILSRIEGDTTKLRTGDGDRTILDELQTVIESMLQVNVSKEPQAENIAIDAEGSTEDEKQEEMQQTEAKKPTSLKSISKLTRMQEQLRRNSFVSYWD